MNHFLKQTGTYSFDVKTSSWYSSHAGGSSSLNSADCGWMLTVCAFFTVRYAEMYGDNRLFRGVKWHCKGISAV